MEIFKHTDHTIINNKKNYLTIDLRDCFRNKKSFRQNRFIWILINLISRDTVRPSLLHYVIFPSFLKNLYKDNKKWSVPIINAKTSSLLHYITYPKIDKKKKK